MLENIEAEQGVLGCIFYEPELIRECRLQPENFSKSHRPLFQVIRDIDNNGDLPDLLTVTGELKKRKLLEEVGGTSYLGDLMNSIVSVASFKGYQRMVFETYRLREAHHMASILTLDTSEENIHRAFKRLGELQEVGIERKRDRKDVLIEIYEDIETDKGEIAGIDTGFKDLNHLTGGLQDSELTVIAARPSVGKTAFALNLALNAARTDCVIDFFSLEMPEKSLVHRMLSALGNIDGMKWRNPHRLFNDHDYAKWTSASGEYGQLDIYIHDEPRQTVADIRAHARKTSKDHPEQKHLIVIDYLQLLTPVQPKQNRNLEVGDMTRELKNMAQEFESPIVLLSQLSRGIENRQKKEPMLSDLRDSGSVEQDANNVFFLHRDDYYNHESEQKNMIEVIIGKQRNGPLGRVELAYMKEYNKFLNLERQYAEVQR